ncbi:MAG TPA: hypothetical protein PLT68_09730 [Actinomycetota bacterium]|nr:hypothetical protein [Actinomycetota bacterium]
MKPGTVPLRWARAWTLGSCSVVLSAVGHVGGGGHADPVLLLLLTVLAGLAGYGWLGRERGLAEILAAVGTGQVIAHLLLSAGHWHPPSPGMLLGHAGAALALAGFLRWGEARLFATVRSRYLRWLVTLRVALAGMADRCAGAVPVVGTGSHMCSAGVHSAGHERAPPVAALC